MNKTIPMLVITATPKKLEEIDITMQGACILVDDPKLGLIKVSIDVETCEHIVRTHETAIASAIEAMTSKPSLKLADEIDLLA